MRIGFGAFSAIFLTVIFVVAGVVVFLAPTPPDSSIANIQPVNPQYLLNSKGSESMLYLVSASPTYGYYKQEPSHSLSSIYAFYQIHKGDQCFIVNVTVRNDYSKENIPPQIVPRLNATGIWFSLDAKLYDKNGIVNAPAVTPPYPQIPIGIPQFYQNSGETDTYELYFATANKNIDHYEIYLRTFGTLPVP